VTEGYLSSGRVVSLVITFVVLTMITPYYCPVVAQTETPTLDPAPLLKLLQDVLSMIIENHYDSALSLCTKSLNISLPSDISYLHTRLYVRLLKLTKLLRSADSLVKEASAGSPKVREVVYELCSIKTELNDVINEYMGRLSKYFKDPATRYVMMEYGKELVNELIVKLDTIINQLVRVYLQGNLSTTKRLLHIEISVPKKILGDSNFSVVLTVKSLINVRKANVSLVAVFANTIVKDLTFTLPVNETAEVTMKAPPAEVLVGSGVKLNEELPVKIAVVAKAVMDNETIIDYVSETLILTYSKPPCTFIIPNIVYPNQSINVSVISRANVTLNLTIYMDKLEDEYILLKSVVKPGENTFTIEPKNLTVGLHKLIFVIEPKGPYQGFTYSAVFALVKLPLTAVVNIQKVLLAPPFSSPLYVYIDTPVPYKLVVYVGDAKVLERTYINKSRIVLNLPIPFTLLMWRYNVKVEVQALDPMYGVIIRSLTIYVVNLPLLIAASIVLGFAMISPVSSRYITFSLKSLILSLRRSLISSEVRAIVKTVESSAVMFRRPKLLKLYRKFLRIISRYVGLPSKSETLREFYRRLSLRVGMKLRQLVSKFLSMYEVDLYSKHEVDVDKAEEVIRRLEEVGSE